VGGHAAGARASKAFTAPQALLLTAAATSVQALLHVKGRLHCQFADKWLDD